jgi:hypothetical protein
VEGKLTITADQTAPVTRIAWLATLVVPLVLAGLLFMASTTSAAPAAPATPAVFGEELEAEEEDEAKESECETAEEEFEEGELGELEVEQLCEEEEGGKAGANSSVAPKECLLRSSHARLVAYRSHSEVRLTVGYTAYEPTAAMVSYRATGGKGSLDLGTARRHLGRSGVIRFTKTLSDAEMAKVDAAGHFTVQFRIAGAPGDCQRFEIERLTVTHTAKNQTVWSPTD